MNGILPWQPRPLSASGARFYKGFQVLPRSLTCPRSSSSGRRKFARCPEVLVVVRNLLQHAGQAAVADVLLHFLHARKSTTVFAIVDLSGFLVSEQIATNALHSHTFCLQSSGVYELVICSNSSTICCSEGWLMMQAVSALRKTQGVGTREVSWSRSKGTGFLQARTSNGTSMPGWNNDSR